MTIPEIRSGQSIELLKALHILTRDGKLNQDSRRKLKQVYHLYQFIEPLMHLAANANGGAFTLADLGAGKSYLGFILYDLFVKARSSQDHIYSIETRADLADRAHRLARDLSFERMSFVNLSVIEAIKAPALASKIDVVCALHACNTATDDAIRFALAKQAQYIVLVPCCQAEVAAVLRKHKGSVRASNALSELWRRPLHTREFGSQITNVLRCLQLESFGYQVTVTELVGWEHSLKNELIIAEQKHLPRAQAAARVEDILQTLGLQEMKTRFFTGA